MNGHLTPAPHVSLSSTKRREEPAPVVLTPTEVGGVKRRHGQVGGSVSLEGESSVDRFCHEEEHAGAQDDSSKEVEVCTISDECFAVPSGYQELYGGGRGTVDQEEELLQMAIQQSLMTNSQPQQLQLEGGEEEEDESQGKGKEEVCTGHVIVT